MSHDKMTDADWQNLKEWEAMNDIAEVIDRRGLYDVLQDLMFYVGSEREIHIINKLLTHYDHNEMELLKTPYKREEYDEFYQDTSAL